VKKARAEPRKRTRSTSAFIMESEFGRIMTIAQEKRSIYLNFNNQGVSITQVSTAWRSVIAYRFEQIKHYLHPLFSYPRRQAYCNQVYDGLW
jgi:hypothetical protein